MDILKWTTGDIQPPYTIEETLYWYDRPVLFTSYINGKLHIITLADTSETYDYFLAFEISQKEHNALKGDKISLWGVMQKPYCLAIELRESSIRIEKFKSEEFAAYLPSKGAALFAHHKVPDTLR